MCEIVFNADKSSTPIDVVKVIYLTVPSNGSLS